MQTHGGEAACGCEQTAASGVSDNLCPRTQGGGVPRAAPPPRHQAERCPACTPCRFLASRAGTGELLLLSSPVCGHLLWLP